MPRCHPLPATLVTLTVWLLAGGVAPAAEEEELGFERTPPRLSFVEGEVSFFRLGARDWAPARVNTPLAPGDELYLPGDSDLEVQIGARAFLRAGENSQLGLTSLEPDFLQLRVTEGQASLDLRALEPAQTFELATPNAAFTIEHAGYYRVEVDGETTSFVTRRGGRASATLASGETLALAASEQVVISGVDAPQIETYAAPELDGWDRWNYARSDRQIEAVSSRYVPAGVYGAYDLDHYGTWRVVPTYGAIWVPRRIAVGWAPYTTGRWVYDPFYGWTWVDAAPWGWAPYHYGRWVHVSGYWGWAPGPIVARPYYAPALVAFYGSGVSVGLSVGGPVGWVALGWGEPLFPWWGPSHFRRRAHWGGWGGPRVVNKVVIKHKKVIHVEDVREYEHSRVRHAFVAVDREHFGRRSVKRSRLDAPKLDDFKPVTGELAPRPSRDSLAPSNDVGRRPPRRGRDRPVVATRAPRLPELPALEPETRRKDDDARAGRDADRRAEPPRTDREVRVVKPPRAPKDRRTLERPPFGTRSDEELAAPPPPPRYDRRTARDREVKREPDRRAREIPEPAVRRQAPIVPPPPSAEPGPPTRRDRAEPRAVEQTRVRPDRGREVPPGTPAEPAGKAAKRRRGGDEDEPALDLPGVPANRVYRGRGLPAAPPAQAPPGGDGPGRGDDDRRGPRRGR